MADGTSEPKLSRLREAYEHVLPAMSNLPERELVPINIDVPAAVTTGLGARPKLVA